MPLRVRGVEAAISSLQTTHKRMTADALQAMHEGALEIEQRAREYAPVDTGNLENAITTSEVISTLGKSEIKVFVADEGDVSKYVLQMHEGSYKLGPLSAAKAKATGKQVGPKFLSRAANELFPAIKQRILNKLRAFR